MLKKGEERKRRIVKIAHGMFMRKGYDSTSVDEIIAMAGIAKGTFYYYFDSKDELLEAVVGEILRECEMRARAILNSEVPIPEKIVGIVMAFRMSGNEFRICEAINKEGNIVMHNRLNVELIDTVVPLLTKVVEEGKREGIFDCNLVPERMRAILILSSKLFDDMRHSEKDVLVFIDIVEKTLGAKPGTMKFIANLIGE